MSTAFHAIGLVGNPRSERSLATLTQVLAYLNTQSGISVSLDADTAAALAPAVACRVCPPERLGADNDLVIVVGGDGACLRAAHKVVESGTPLLGINRGRVGFLAQIPSDGFEPLLAQVLSGDYQPEARMMLTAETGDESERLPLGLALNDVVLTPSHHPRMLEFEIYLDKRFMCSERADGLIVATPTGSTAYALSGGGPILHPGLKAIVIVPMFPQTLSSRPIVIHSHFDIDIVLSSPVKKALVSCDGQTQLPLSDDGHLHIVRHPRTLNFIHPTNYHYFETLRRKLHWGKQL